MIHLSYQHVDCALVFSSLVARHAAYTCPEFGSRPGTVLSPGVSAEGKTAFPRSTASEPSCPPARRARARRMGRRLRGFGMRVHPSGARCTSSRPVQGRIIKMTIGPHHAVSATSPASAPPRSSPIARARQEPKGRRSNAPTCGDWGAILREYVPNYCKQSTAAEYRGSVELSSTGVSAAPASRMSSGRHIARTPSRTCAKTALPGKPQTLGVVVQDVQALAELWELRPDGSKPLSPCEALQGRESASAFSQTTSINVWAPPA